MFAGWFAERASGSENRDNALANSTVAPAEDNARKDTLVSVDSQPSVAPQYKKSGSPFPISDQDRAIGQTGEMLGEMQPDPYHGVTNSQAISGPEGAEPLQESQAAKTRNRAVHENMYDPFDGQSIGMMVPGEFEEAEDDLWTHLARIRDLQSEIARMHSHMEGLGEGERSHRSGQTVDDETINAEEEVKAAKAAEFAKLSDRFNGRKDAIDAIMAKLETLSHAINDFHTSRAPVFRLLNASELHTNMKKPQVETKGTVETVTSQTKLRGSFGSYNDTMLNCSPESEPPEVHSRLFDADYPDS
ncbi:hypothetical protein M0805_007018 [Coniferiporia weirii]|nr:hypothetical protein M0805_007018 [Coniferiporia weirii]